MEEKTELNDIILNQGDGGNGNKKILLAVASLAIILIIIVVIMNSLQSNNIENLPKPILPKEPQVVAKKIIDEDPLFEPIDVVEEPSDVANIDQITKKLKEESLQKEQSHRDEIEEAVIIEEPPKKAQEVVAKKAKETIKPLVEKKPVAEKKPIVEKKPVVVKAPTVHKPKTGYTTKVIHGKHYIQVGSFSQYAPNKTFLRKITGNGYSYTYYKVTVKGKTINKVIIGPFNSKAEARRALSTIRKRIERGAFIIKV